MQLDMQKDKKQKDKKTIFIGAAWPYANGSLHLGHVASLLAGDILARYHRLKGDDVLFVSGSDCHGTPIAIEAEKQGVKPQEIAWKYHKEFVKTFRGLSFSYDLYTKTTTENHEKVVWDIFLKLYKAGYIYTKTEKLPYCEKCQRFLPDRYIEGECPKCHNKNARGDQCDGCGQLMDAHELLNLHCKICGYSPKWKESEHFFLRLCSFKDKLKQYVKQSSNWRSNAKNFTLNLLAQDLPDRAISRDLDWGVRVPLNGYDSKKIYVWFEAVCGYLSASKEWAKTKGQSDLWQKFWLNKNSIHYYVHGKDNIPFHTIIWPSILMGYGDLHLPDRIISSEYLTLEKQQFSKSRNWAVYLPDFLKNFDFETLRYYLVINGPETADADFSWSAFQAKINNELIGNFGNLILRTFSLIKNNFPSGIEFPKKLDNQSEKLTSQAKQCFNSVGKLIEQGHFRQALKNITLLSDEANRYLTETAPWKSIKENFSKAQKDLAIIAQIIRCLAILISPFLPNTFEKISQIINWDTSQLSWQYPSPTSIKIKTNNLKPLYKKIEDVEIEKQTSLLGKS